jgi:multidrug efflux pump subunit AcrB
MAGNPVASNLLMLLLLVGGFLMMSNVRQEVFPETRIDVVNIAVPYPGASPSEVEQGVVLAVEEALLGIEGVDRITATASEGAALVSVELMDGVEPYSVTAEVQAAVDRITSLPQDVERPTVSLASHVTETASVIFYGDVSERTLRDLAQRARDDLLSDPRITDVEVTEVRPVEISVEIPQENLRRYGLTHQQVAAIIGASSVELPAGAIDAESGEILLRTSQRRELGPEFADIVLLATPDGTRVRLGDVATVIDGFQDTDQQALFNGLPASRVRVFRAGSQTPIELSDAIYAYLDGPGSRLPPGVEAEVWFDRSEMYRDRINLLLKNAYIGLILVLIVLGAFLQIKLAFWVTLGIPISFLGAVLLMPSLDVSFNMISLFAFILSLGIVVDDAIVVGEAIHHRQKTGLKGVDAAIAGVRDVAVPVTFSVLTTIIAFTPLLFIPGVTGRFVRNIPLIVISVFVISLIESLFILPAHLAHSHEKPVGGLLGAAQRAQAVFSRAFDRFIERFFRPTLQPALRARYLTLAIALAGVILSIGLVAAGKVKFTYMPRVESDVVSASLRMPFGTPVERTREIVDRMIAELDVVLDEHGGDDITRGIYASIGSGAESFGPGGGGSGGSHVASVSLNMVPIDDRSVTAGAERRPGSHVRLRRRTRRSAEVDGRDEDGPGAVAPRNVRADGRRIPELPPALDHHVGHSFRNRRRDDRAHPDGILGLDAVRFRNGRALRCRRERLAPARDDDQRVPQQRNDDVRRGCYRSGPPIPPHPDDVAHDVLRTRADDSRDIGAGALPHPHGDQPRVRHSLRHGHHSRPRPMPLSRHRRCRPRGSLDVAPGSRRAVDSLHARRAACDEWRTSASLTSEGTPST